MNKKSLICNGAVALASVLMLVFMAFDYITGTPTGYDFIKFTSECFQVGEFAYIALWLASMLGLVIMVALLAYAVYKILRVCGVIKTDKLDKIFGLIALICSIVLVALFVMAILGELIMVEFKYFEILGWALIVNTVLSIASLVAVIFGKKA